MNPLTLVKRIQSMNSKEASLGISEEASWHAKYKDSAYVFVGGIPFDLTEGDLLAIFAQYGEIVDVNLVRDKGTGKSKGFSFVAYEDQRSTNLAVDNLNGAQILGRIIRVDHCSKYKKKEEEDEEAEQKKREERGVCRAFQKGECTRGAGCKFSHDEQRAANTGWGADDKTSTWGHDKYEGQRRGDRRPSRPDHTIQDGFRSNDKDSRRPYDQSGRTLKVKGDDEDKRGRERQSEWKEKNMDRDVGKKSTRHEFEETSREAERREATRSSRHKSGSYPREEQDSRGGHKTSTRNRDNSSHQFEEEDCYRKLDR